MRSSVDLLGDGRRDRPPARRSNAVKPMQAEEALRGEEATEGPDPHAYGYVLKHRADHLSDH
jgi:hypothetical protein